MYVSGKVFNDRCDGVGWFSAKDISTKWRWSLDHLVRPRHHVRRNRQTDLLRRLEIDHQLELRRSFHRQISGLRTFQDLVDVGGGAVGQVGEICPVAYKATIVHKLD